MEPISPPVAQNVPPRLGTDRVPKVDLIFPVHGRTILVDHGYALFSAISRLLESPDNQWLHESDNVGIHPCVSGNGG